MEPNRPIPVETGGELQLGAPVSACLTLEPAHGRAAVLVVEDEVLVRAMVTEELRSQGYTVIEAVDADEALSVLRSDVNVGLLLTDVRMPGTLNGMDLARLVRVEYPAIKVVMTSGTSTATQLDAPVDAFFPKPYDLPRLVERIQAILP